MSLPPDKSFENCLSSDGHERDPAEQLWEMLHTHYRREVFQGHVRDRQTILKRVVIENENYEVPSECEPYEPVETLVEPVEEEVSIFAVLKRAIAEEKRDEEDIAEDHISVFSKIKIAIEKEKHLEDEVS